jgi:hypothetical protein
VVGERSGREDALPDAVAEVPFVSGSAAEDRNPDSKTAHN